nr:hypothetical protein [Candidatus Sigynarchaeota archaeon]
MTSRSKAKKDNSKDLSVGRLPPAKKDKAITLQRYKDEVITEDDMVLLKEKYYCLVHKGPSTATRSSALRAAHTIA